MKTSSKTKSKAAQRPGRLPKDVYPGSGYRLPAPQRGDLDDEGKKIYDGLIDPDSHSLVGLWGPRGFHLHSPRLQALMSAVNDYLRFESGFDGRTRELAILVAAREMNSQFEWTVHEPQALKEGLSGELIDLVRYRKGTAGLPEKEAVIIRFGRQMLGRKKVDSKMFARALKVFGTKQTVDLIAMMANYAGTALELSAFEMQLPPGKEPLLPPLE